MSNIIKNMPDRRMEFAEIHSIKDYKDARKKNLKDGYWACACGSRLFYLLQQKENVKTICAICNNIDIIYWNGTSDNAKGSMLRLDTDTWVSPKIKLEIK